MSVTLPNGTKFYIGDKYSAEKQITAITNASPAVATCEAHGFSDGEYIYVKSGWSDINERSFRVANAEEDTFELEGVDTSDTDKFIPGGGAGTAKSVDDWTQIQQITDTASSGGDMQFVTYSFLESDTENQLPSQASAKSITLTIGDDPTLPGYAALKKASDARSVYVVRAALPTKSQILYNCYVSLNETPTMTKGEIMAVTATLSLQGKETRYASES